MPVEKETQSRGKKKTPARAVLFFDTNANNIRPFHSTNRDKAIKKNKKRNPPPHRQKKENKRESFCYGSEKKLQRKNKSWNVVWKIIQTHTHTAGTQQSCANTQSKTNGCWLKKIRCKLRQKKQLTNHDFIVANDISSDKAQVVQRVKHSFRGFFRRKVKKQRAKMNIWIETNSCKTKRKWKPEVGRGGWVERSSRNRENEINKQGKRRTACF